MDYVKSHISRPHNAHDRVEVGSVVIAQPSPIVDNAGNLQDILVKEPYRVWIGQHQSCRVLPHCLLKLIQIHTSVLPGGDADNAVAGHGGAGGIGAVGRVRNNDFRPLFIPSGVMVSLDQQQTRKFPMGACRGLEGHCIHTGYLAQILLRQIEYPEGAPARMFRLQRMDARTALQRRRLLIYLWVILHGAGAKGVETVVDAVGAPRKAGIMSADFIFRELRKIQLLLPANSYLMDRHVAVRKQVAVPAGSSLFKY